MSLLRVLVAAMPAAGAMTACTKGPEKTERLAGQRLLAQYQCGSCHVVPGVPGAGGRQAVSLEGFGARSYIAGRLPNDRDTLMRWITSPATLIPDTPMPDMGVSEVEAREMAAYLHSLE